MLVEKIPVDVGTVEDEVVDKDPVVVVDELVVVVEAEVVVEESVAVVDVVVIVVEAEVVVEESVAVVDVLVLVGVQTLFSHKPGHFTPNVSKNEIFHEFKQRGLPKSKKPRSSKQKWTLSARFAYPYRPPP